MLISKLALYRPARAFFESWLNGFTDGVLSLLVNFSKVEKIKVPRYILLVVYTT